MDPAFIDRRTQVDTAASGAVVEVWAGRGILLDSIVTMDKTWVHCSTLDSKYSSIQCLHPGSLKPKKAKTMFSAWKVMAIIFWDSKGILYMDFLKGHCTINTEYYSALLEGPVKTAVRNKRKRTQTSVSFPQDIARLHMGARTMDTIHKVKWNILPHPPYSLDLAPSGYNLFSPI